MASDQEAAPSSSTQIGPILVRVVIGELTRLGRHVGAIVSPEDVYLCGMTATAKAIRHAAASEVVQRQIAVLAGWPTARSPLRPGCAVRTEAGTLDARALLHAVILADGNEPDPGAVRTAFRRALELADAGELDPVALPVASGTAGTALFESVTEATAGAIVDFAHGSPRAVRTILLVARSSEPAGRMAQVLGEIGRDGRETQRRVAARVEALAAHVPAELGDRLRRCASPRATASELFDGVHRLVVFISAAIEVEAQRLGALPREPRPEAPVQRVVDWTLGTARSLRGPGAPAWIAALADSPSPVETEGDDNGSQDAPLAVVLTRAARLLGKILRSTLVGDPVTFRADLDAVFAGLVGGLGPHGGPEDGLGAARHDSSRPPDTVRTHGPPPAAERAPRVTTAADSAVVSEPLVDKLARLLERRMTGTSRARLDAWLTRYGYVGDRRSQIVELCLDTDPLRLLVELFDPGDLSGMLPAAKAEDLRQAGPDVLAAHVLRGLGFSVASPPEGIRAIAAFVARTERLVLAPQSDQEARGAVVDAARAVERVCHDLLCLYGTLLFGPDWRAAMGDRGLWTGRDDGPPTLGTLLAALRRLDSYLERGEDPVASGRWADLLGGKLMLGELGAHGQDFAALRNAVVHDRRNERVSGLHGAALREQASDLYARVVRPLFAHLTGNAVYPPVVVVLRHVVDVYGRSYAEIIDETGAASTIVTRERIEPGASYFMIARSSPARIHPLLVRREER